MGLIEYRVRSQEEADAVRLCNWPIDKAEELIREIKRAGGIYDGEDHRCDICFRLVYMDGECFMELIYENGND